MSKLRIVIVEDDELLLQQFQRMLAREKYDVFAATNAPAAIDTIDSTMPDVILLDVLLSGTTALALLHEMQSHADLAKIPVIMVTNLADDIDLENVSSYGVTAILDKTSMHPGELIAAIRRAVS